MAWSGFGQMHLNLEASQYTGIFGPGFWQDANGPLPVFQLDKVAFFHRRPGSYCTKPAVLGFGPNGSGPKARRCARIIRPASGQHFRADQDWM